MHALGANDYSESDPAILPERKHVLIVVSDKSQHRRIELASLTSSETKFVLDDGRQPAYSSGFLVSSGTRKYSRNLLMWIPAKSLAPRLR